MVYGHLDDPENQDIQRGVSYLNLRPGGQLLLLWGHGGGCQGAGRHLGFDGFCDRARAVG